MSLKLKIPKTKEQETKSTGSSQKINLKTAKPAAAIANKLNKPKKAPRLTKAKMDLNEKYKELEKEVNTFKEDWKPWRKHLYEHGWCVVPGVLSRDRSDQYVGRFWDWLEAFQTGIKRNNSSTWTSDKFPSALHGGLLQHYGIGQSQFIWDIRSETNVINVFKEIYGTEKLLVSFDGANLSRPVSSTERYKPWSHFDQGSHRSGFACIQGFLNLEDCGDHDGGLIVYQGSHLKHEAFFKESGNVSQGDWFKFEEEPSSLSWFKDCPKIKVNCKKGDVVLWDSRTIHYACVPSGQKGSGVCRTVVYVSYQPVSLATEKDLESKRDAFRNNRMTSHWASTVKLFPKNPRTYGNDAIINNFPFPDTNKSILNDTGKRLAGLIPYDEED